MGILDEAIREHLELKRQHGADENELKGLEDEAFGQAERPDAVSPTAEAETEIISPGSSLTTPAGEGDQLLRLQPLHLRPGPSRVDMLPAG